MSFRAQRYDPSWRSRPPCARGGDPPGSPQSLDEFRLEMVRKIEAIASAVAKKQQHDCNSKVRTSFLLQWMSIHIGWQQEEGLCCVYQKDEVQDRKQHEENANLDCQKSRLWVRLLVSLEWRLAGLKTSMQNSIIVGAKLFAKAPLWVAVPEWSSINWRAVMGYWQNMLSYPVSLARVVQDKWSITSRTQLETTTQNLLDAGIKRVNWCKEHDRLEATQATQWDEAAELPHQNGSYQSNYVSAARCLGWTAMGYWQTIEWNPDAWHEQGLQTENLHFSMSEGNSAVLDQLGQCESDWPMTTHKSRGLGEDTK